MTPLSPNFSLEELARTGVKRYAAENLAGAKLEILALRALATTLLQPVRDWFEAPVFVHSGFRCKALNAAIGGSPTSQHQRGEAADVHLYGIPLTEVWEWIAWTSELPFGQVILEGAEPGKPMWLHLSLGPPWRSPEKSGQVLTWDAKNGYRAVKRPVAR